MAKKANKRTPQETMVAGFAAHSISALNTFHPNLWKKSGREPADMVILLGRALVLVNMTEGKSYFEDLVAHNVDQARLRMADWEGGLTIKGENRFRKFDIAWDDIDYVAVISVVDGRHAACALHELPTLKLDRKVRLCASVTLDIMMTLAHLGGGARDLLAVCIHMSSRGKLTPREAMLILQGQYNLARKHLEASTAVSKQFPGGVIRGRHFAGFEYWYRWFIALRQSLAQPVNEASVELVAVFSELDWSEVCTATSFISQSIAEMEALIQGQIRTAAIGNPPSLAVIVSTNMDVLVKRGPEIYQGIKDAGIYLTISLSVNSIGVLPTIAIWDAIGPTKTERLLASLSERC